MDNSEKIPFPRDPSKYGIPMIWKMLRETDKASIVVINEKMFVNVDVASRLFFKLLDDYRAEFADKLDILESKIELQKNKG